MLTLTAEQIENHQLGTIILLFVLTANAQLRSYDFEIQKFAGWVGTDVWSLVPHLMITLSYLRSIPVPSVILSMNARRF